MNKLVKKIRYKYYSIKMKLYEWLSMNSGEPGVDLDLMEKAKQANIERGKYCDE